MLLFDRKPRGPATLAALCSLLALTDCSQRRLAAIGGPSGSGGGSAAGTGASADAGRAGDAGAGGDAGAEGANEGWCATAASSTTLLCRDFDDGSPYDAGWASIYYQPSPIARLDDEGSPPSAPNAVLFSTPELAEGSVQHQLKPIFSSSTGFDLQFALQVQDFDPGTPDLTLVTVYIQGSTSWMLGVDMVGDLLQLTEVHSPAEEGAEETWNPHPAPLPELGSWSDVKLSLRTSAEEVTASLSYDGRVVIGPVPLSPPQPPKDVELVLGVAVVYAPARPMSIRYDNIKIDSAPP